MGGPLDFKLDRAASMENECFFWTDLCEVRVRTASGWDLDPTITVTYVVGRPWVGQPEYEDYFDEEFGDSIPPSDKMTQPVLNEETVLRFLKWSMRRHEKHEDIDKVFRSIELVFFAGDLNGGIFRWRTKDRILELIHEAAEYCKRRATILSSHGFAAKRLRSEQEFGR